MPNVPNQFPKLPNPKFRLAIVGDIASVEDGVMNTPFISAAGQLLRRTLGSNALAADMCYLGNIIQDPKIDIDTISYDSDIIQMGLLRIRQELASFKPNLTLLLGNLPLRAFCPNCASISDKGTKTWSLPHYRGSLLLSLNAGILPEGHQKVLPTYHPSTIQRVYGDVPYFRWDIRKAVQESSSPRHLPPTRNIVIRPTLSEVTTYIMDVRNNRLTTGFDVEGWNDNVGVTCFSIAKSPTDCLVIPLVLQGHKNYWTLEEETEIWKLTAGWLTDPQCGKIVTNAAYEQFILAWKHNICIVNIVEDTMLKHWECFPELEKSLAIQASVWTNEPYYKHERTSDSDDGKLLYNGKDSCISYEASVKQEETLVKLPKAYEHYRFNISLLPSMQYLMLRGVKFDVAKAEAHKAEAVQRHDHLLGQITSSLKRDFNVKSTHDKQWLLYDYLGYTPYVKYGKTTAEEVLLRYYARDREPILKLLIDAIQQRTRISDINKFTLNEDGRLRCNYNLVGTDTGRLSSSSSSALVAYFTKKGILKWEDTGTNMQNVTKDLRDCCIPDSDDFFFWNCDLSGADGWTVAADLAALGNSTMLEDYTAGIKPAKVLLLMLAEYEAGRDPATINQLDRTTLRNLTKALKFPDTRDEHGRPGDWKYLCMKRVQHGSNYDMQPDKLAATIFKDSDGLIDLTAKQAGIYQYLYKLRYNPKSRIDWIARQLGETGYIQTASGIRRQFFNIRSRIPDPQVVRAALAFEPQANTTFATNAALRNLWTDTKNRTSRGSLFVEPLIQIHDALSGQFKKSHANFAVDRIRSYFSTELIIHGIKITIPFEGGYGRDWKNSHDVEFS